jgi:hypothetical protein
VVCPIGYKDGNEMAVTRVYPEVRAVHHDDVLELFAALDLPEGAEVRLSILPEQPVGTGSSPAAALVYPTRLVPAERLRALTGVIEAGGDALTDSEALYDRECH